MTTSPREEDIKKIAREAHIEWLEKAETAKINGSEMTVLPYGYLSQAVEKALTSQQDQIEVRMREWVEENSRETMHTDHDAGEDGPIETVVDASDLLQALPTIIRNQEGR